MRQKLFGGWALLTTLPHTISPPSSNSSPSASGTLTGFKGYGPREGRGNKGKMKWGAREEKGRKGEGRGVMPLPKQKSGCATDPVLLLI